MKKQNTRKIPTPDAPLCKRKHTKPPKLQNKFVNTLLTLVSEKAYQNHNPQTPNNNLLKSM